MKLANTIVYFLSLLMLLSNTSFADNSFKKEIKHTYSAAEYDQLKLSNQFGEIQIITKDIPTINIRVVIRIDASDLDEANRLFRYIQIIHTDESRVLDYKTQLESSFNKKKFEINY
ncbi:MAG: hypothetical protein RIS47_448, partial [Bacteroidota bacterium]